MERLHKNLFTVIEYVNIHFHILFLDGVYVYHENRPPRFLRVKARDKSAFEQNQGVLILPILRPPAFNGILFSQGANPQPQISKDACASCSSEASSHHHTLRILLNKLSGLCSINSSKAPEYGQDIFSYAALICLILHTITQVD